MATGGFVFYDHAFVNSGGMLKSASSQSDTDYGLCKAVSKESFQLPFVKEKEEIL